MANEKQTNVRILLKNDIEANWLKATAFIPREGELIIYSAEKDTDELPTNRTYRIKYPRFKAGDGITNVIDLPFFQTPQSYCTAIDDGNGYIALENQMAFPVEEAIF